VICGNALERRSYERLLRDDVAQMVVTDPPYNVPIAGHAMGRGKIRHRNFEQAAGEMSPAEFIEFLERFVRLAIAFSHDGSIHYIFMDWRHLQELLKAARLCIPNGRTCWSGTRTMRVRAVFIAPSTS
jgi:hypothetical protein